MLDLVDPGRAGEPGRFVPYSLLHDIADLVPCDDVTFQVQDPVHRTLVLQALCPDDDGPADADLLELWWPALWENCSYPLLTGDYSTVIRESDDLPGGRQGPRWAAFVEACGGFPPHDVIVSLPPEGTIDRRLLLWRDSGPDFSDREVLILTLLRPHIIALHRRHQVLLAGTPDLTPRQVQIMRLVGRGCTNRQVARELVLSEATVRKHLENIFTRLQVNSRTEALSRCGDILQPG
jgi:DNA-binding CsgD family transcriptional regulator